jgi:uncharacterized membrane protein
LFVPVLLWAIFAAPWVELFTDSRRQHLLFGTVFALFMLWLVRRDFDTGVSYHFIGMTAVTLLLDWPLALSAGWWRSGLVSLGRQDLAGGRGQRRVADRVAGAGHRRLRDPGRARAAAKSLCVYLLFRIFAAALSALLCLLVGLAAVVRRAFCHAEWLEDFVGYLWLLIFPEAFINGMVISALVVFCPEWLETFNRTRYLSAPWKDDDPQS